MTTYNENAGTITLPTWLLSEPELISLFNTVLSVAKETAGSLTQKDDECLQGINSVLQRNGYEGQKITLPVG